MAAKGIEPQDRQPGEAGSSMPEREVRELLERAAISVDGSQPWDIQVHDARFYRRVLGEGSLGLGESYMEGWWDCAQLDGFIHRVLRAELDQEVGRLPALVQGVRSVVSSLQAKARVLSAAQQHYDLGNELFERMLDPRMIYSCGYWANAEDLQQAQEAKLELICRKLDIQPGARVLDIGCGWGGFAEYVAQRHGASVLAITLSQEQASLARQRCAGLDVEIRVQDYRELEERFDRIVSIGMFEHVGGKSHATFMEVAHRCLKDNGLFLLHSIGCNQSRLGGDPWIDRYIFPGGALPSPTQLTRVLEGRFVIEDWHNFGADYDRTLMAWHDNIEAAWDSLSKPYDQSFRRMWRYYLLSCAGSFRARRNQLWQLVLSKRGVPGGYRSVR